MSMEIVKVDIANFRALELVSVPLQQLSILLGENDVGKTSFLYALENFFIGKKLTDPKDWYKRNTDNAIRITITFKGFPEDDTLIPLLKTDGTIVISKIFSHDTRPEIRAILDDQSAIAVAKPTLDKWFSQESFHFIPVRRDLAVQFSMNKTAMLGKLLRARMRASVNAAGAEASLNQVRTVLQDAISEPRKSMQSFLREQLSNDSIQLGFDDLEIDPTEGVKFSVTLSDDRVKSIDIQDRGAGTQNNLIIALFRLIADSNVEGNFIFAMEEPENSLHPKAQRQLLNVIQEISASTQVIVTTHSPVFIDRSKFESNILLTRTLSGNTIAKVFAESALAEVRTDLGIRASDALLKGGGNCAVLVEGKTEEDGFPVFMEMMGQSEFELGIAIINMGGSDLIKTKNIIQLLKGYDIPCVVVLDRDAQKTADDLNRMLGNELDNLRQVFCLKNGTIEDYYPPSVVAEVINQEFSPETPITEEELDQNWSGRDRLSGYKKIMFEHKAGDSLEYLKSALGRVGTRILKDKGESLHPEIAAILETVEGIARES
jgi:ABC-type branched-subunit amino acid transport system ATPase component|tara:strand:+ start:1996 stop:3633 length:1638 start_codon:yes stop_codon:yes gene_type:complete